MHSYRSLQVDTEQYCLLSCFFLGSYIPSELSCPMGWAGLWAADPRSRAPCDQSHHRGPASRGGGCQQSCCCWMQGWNGPQGAPTLVVLPEEGYGRIYLPQGPGLLCSISSRESVICWILSYRLGGQFLSSALGREQRGVRVGQEKSIPTT